jgi:signal peptide peptidase SppA
MPADFEMPTAALVVVEGRNWAMQEPKLRAMCEYLSGHLLAAAPLEARVEKPVRTSGNVSLVALKGIITPAPSLLAMLFGGGGGLSQFMSDMRAAIGDPDTRAVVIDIDSPGGMVDLVPEVASELRAMRETGGKPIVAVANTTAASAAYWIGAQANELLVTPSGEVGSVGVYSVHRDMSEAFTAKGIRHTLVSAGARKVEGNPFEPLNDEARADMQQAVDDHYEMFVRDVAAGRNTEMPDLSDGEAFGAGRAFSAKRAVKLGLVDGVATLGETVARLSSSRSRVRNSAVQYDKDQRLRLLDALTSR